MRILAICFLCFLCLITSVSAGTFQNISGGVLEYVDIYGVTKSARPGDVVVSYTLLHVEAPDKWSLVDNEPLYPLATEDEIRNIAAGATETFSITYDTARIQIANLGSSPLRVFVNSTSNTKFIDLIGSTAANTMDEVDILNNKRVNLIYIQNIGSSASDVKVRVVK